MSAAPAADLGLSVRLARDRPRECDAQAQLGRLLQAHDVSRWVVTRDLVIAKACGLVQRKG